MDRKEFDQLLDQISEQVDRISDQLNQNEQSDGPLMKEQPPPYVYIPKRHSGGRKAIYSEQLAQQSLNIFSK